MPPAVRPPGLSGQVERVSGRLVQAEAALDLHYEDGATERVLSRELPPAPIAPLGFCLRYGRHGQARCSADATMLAAARCR